MLLCTCDGEDTISHLCSQFSTDCIANCRRCLDYHKIRTLSGWQCSMQKKKKSLHYTSSSFLRHSILSSYELPSCVITLCTEAKSWKVTKTQPPALLLLEVLHFGAPFAGIFNKCLWKDRFHNRLEASVSEHHVYQKFCSYYPNHWFHQGSLLEMPHNTWGVGRLATLQLPLPRWDRGLPMSTYSMYVMDPRYNQHSHLLRLPIFTSLVGSSSSPDTEVSP